MLDLACKLSFDVHRLPPMVILHVVLYGVKQEKQVGFKARPGLDLASELSKSSILQDDPRKSCRCSMYFPMRLGPNASDNLNLDISIVVSYRFNITGNPLIAY